MSASVSSRPSSLALDVAAGLSSAGQKNVSAHYFYDDLGSALFEAITLLPEYGLTRADERLLRRHAVHIASETGFVSRVVELGSGNGKKTRHVLEALLRATHDLVYCPIDVSAAALDACERELSHLCTIRRISADWIEGLAEVARTRKDGSPLLLLFLGSSIGNVDRDCIVEFLNDVRFHLRAGDFFLLGADLVKDVNTMLAAYDDVTGVTAAFNLNLLGRLNRELETDFDLRSFTHEVRWDEQHRRIEMHLLSCRDQIVHAPALDLTFTFRAGETIWTESSHKFTESELNSYARSSGFEPVAAWTDREWPFVETLWRAS